MLQFILGRASSGKTYAVTQKIAESVSKGETPVLLVPEQFSFESEKNILDFVGDSAAQKVSVLSFTRICDDVERINGGVCGESVTDADRIILMKRAIRNSYDSLKRFKKYINSSSFASLMVDTVEEFKTAFVMAEDLYRVAEETDDEQLKLKLYDTAVIYENYEILMSERFFDSTDRLTKLYYALENYRYFDGKTVFVDSFKSFSGQQYKILERIISQSNSVTISLVDNVADKRELGLFSNIKKVKNRIITIAKKFGVTVADDIVLDKSNYAHKDLAALEEFMATGKTCYDGECKNVTVCCADNIYGEADFAARNIRRIVREQNARYSDFVIIARDTQTYEDALEIACKKNNVSCFIDKRIPLCEMPTAVAMLSAANATKSLTTENILRFHKSGINILDYEQIATLENYTYLWHIDGKQWFEEWTMNPDGFSADGELSSQSAENLKAINSIRKKAIKPFEILKEEFSDNAENMATALINMFENCNASENFKKLSKKIGSDTLYGDAVRQSWDSIMRILNSLVICYGKSQISKSEFCESLSLAFSLETVGVIPQMIDEAVFGAADRIRPSRPKYAFILGVNNGVFPRLEQKDGLFSNTEREKLISHNVDICDKSFSVAVDEECLIYSNVCCASHGVFICYSSSVDATSSAEPSDFAVDISKRFNIPITHQSATLTPDNLPESYEDAFSQFCSSVSSENSDLATFTEVLKNSDMNDRVQSVISLRERICHSISHDTAKKLYGEKITMSPSKFDTFSRCRFMHFCRYGLRVERLQPAEFNAMQRGTLVHYVLQRAVEDYGKSLGELTTNQISDLVENYVKQYLDMIAGYSDIETPHLKYLVTTIKRSLKFVVGRLSAEFAQSDFTPVKCELKIGKDGDMPEIKIPIENEGILQVTGMIDRLDSWNGYIRIVDYKTGKREFKLPDILFGQNMQMLIYLYAVSKNSTYGGKSAGIFYMSASRDKTNKKSERCMNGLIVADSQLVTAMDKENNGEFIPQYKEEKPSNSYITAENFEEIFDFIESSLKKTGKSMYSGDIAANPIDGQDSVACKYCEYQNICRIDKEEHQTVPKLTNDEVMEEIKRQVNENGI